MKTARALFINDAALIDQYKAGSTQALGILYVRYFGKVFYKCFSFVKDYDQASDLTQDILLKTFEHLDSFKGISQFSTWLYSIATNHCIEYMRKEQKLQKVDITYASRVSVPDENSDVNHEIFYQSFNTIPIQEKELLDLKYLQNQSIKDLQEKYHTSASAIKMRLKRARKKVEESYLNNTEKVR